MSTNKIHGPTKICLLNIQSLKKKVSEFNHFLITNQIGICILSETWLKPSDKISIPNYSIERKDRSNGHQGGGVLIACHCSIPYERINLDSLPVAQEEIISIKIPKITSTNQDIYLVGIYNPPKTAINNFNNNINQIVLKRLSQLGNKVLIMGDFNAHNPIWLSNGRDSCGEIIENFLEEEEFLLLNDDSPTYQSHANPDHQVILDLALCSDSLSQDIIDCKISEFSNSDHNPVFVDIKGRNPPSFQKISKSVKKIDWDLFKKSCYQKAWLIDSERINTKEDLDSVSASISACIQDSLDIASSTKTITYDPNAHMILPKEIVKAIEEKKECKKRLRATKNPIFKTMLNKLDHEIKLAIKTYKQKKWEIFCSSLNSFQVSDSILWRKLRSIETSKEQKQRKTPILRSGSTLESDPESVANIFAENLEQVFENSDDPSFDINHKELIESNISGIFTKNETKIDEVNSFEVHQAIKNLRSRGAPGEDGITNKCLKNLPVNALNILTSIFNFSLKFNHIPYNYKNATIIMIPKPMKDGLNPSNYRPISLLNTLSKLLERIIMNRLQYWIKEQNLITPLQCGFVRHRQTSDHLLRITQNGLESFNRNEKMGAIFVDIEKAFDKVWHDGLLYKLEKMNIPNYLGKWIQEYLTNRTFQVRVENYLSIKKFIKAGVPQGSVLGPTLFNLFFNDISETKSLNVEMGLFADDLSSWTSNSNINIINIRLQRQLDKTQDWMSKWRTKLSISKTVWTLFTRGGTLNSNALSLTYENKPIQCARNPKFLGVTLDPGLRFHVHAETIRARATKRLNMMRKIRGRNWGASSKLLLTTYKVLIRSLIDYIPFINLIYEYTNYLKIERIQRQAARYIIYWPLKTRTQVIYDQINLEDIQTRAWTLTDKYMTKALQSNDLIRSLVENYKPLSRPNEGAFSKTQPKLTIFGEILRRDELNSHHILFEQVYMSDIHLTN